MIFQNQLTCEIWYETRIKVRCHPNEGKMKKGFTGGVTQTKNYILITGIRILVYIIDS